jgi:hypothetical protein
MAFHYFYNVRMYCLKHVVSPIKTPNNQPIGYQNHFRVLLIVVRLMPESDETSPHSELSTSTESFTYNSKILSLFNSVIRSKLANQHRALKTAILKKAS